MKCSCHCHAGGNYKDCTTHKILSCEHCVTKNTNSSVEDIKASIATVVSATKCFIEGKINRADREMVYDKHMEFIKNLLALQRKELREKIGVMKNSASKGGGVFDDGYIAAIDNISSLLDEVKDIDVPKCPCPLSCGDNPPCGSCIGWHGLKSSL